MRKKKIKGKVREREKKERERKIDRETERIIEVKREEKIQRKGNVVHRKEGKGEAERDLHQTGVIVYISTRLGSLYTLVHEVSETSSVSV